MREILVNRIYRHFKGDLYLVEGIAKDTETNVTYVVYRALYGKNELFVRPLEMFASEVDHQKYPDCKTKYRFTLEEVNSVKK